MGRKLITLVLTTLALSSPPGIARAGGSPIEVPELAAARAPGPIPLWPVALAGAAFASAIAAFVLGRRPYATRTLVTGANRSWTENQDAPASAEPKTSPLVAPK